MKGPLTRRRERRILMALAALGPLDDWDLYRLLNATQGKLNKALINLAAAGLIAAKPRRSLLNGGGHVWRMADTADDGD